MNLEIFHVVKKDEYLEGFDEHKLYRSIYYTAKGSGMCDETSENIALVITKKMKQHLARNNDYFQGLIESSVIRSFVFDYLKETNRSDMAKLYTSYHIASKKSFAGTKNVEQMVDSVMNMDSNVLHENANKDSKVVYTVRDLTVGSVAKAVGMSRLPIRVAKAHHKGQIHFHDLDNFPYSATTNCCLIDFENMLKHGFTIGNAQVESPKSIGTAMAQISQVIANVASSQYGGCSFNRADEVLAPYAQLNYDKHLSTLNTLPGVDKEKLDELAIGMTCKDIADAVQAHEYEINTLYTSSGQTPFYTLNFGLGTSRWEREIQKAILNTRINGLGSQRRTAIFPKLTMGIKEGVNLRSADPNYDIKKLALKCSSIRDYPDILNYDKLVEVTGNYKSPMGCRSFLQAWKDEDGKEVNDGRMNLGVVTLNLPRIALESKGDKDMFWGILSNRLSVVDEALTFRLNYLIDNATPDIAPILYKNGAFGKKLSSNDNVSEVFNKRRGTLSIGYIGLYEVATVFYGPSWENNPEAKEFTLEILRKLKQEAESLSEREGIHYSVYGTPSESLTDRFCRLDAEYFGSIPDVTDKGYYMNSFHYDTRKHATPFEKIDFEKDYVPLSSGGFINYVEYGIVKNNLPALEAVWDYSYDKVAYLGTNASIDRCFECDYLGEFEQIDTGYKCPVCGNSDPGTSDVVKRLCGYLGNPQLRPSVKGRRKEMKSRVKHIK